MVKVFKHEDLPRIFERGYTGKQSSIMDQYKSTGMGLYMVDKLISKQIRACIVM